MLRWDRVVKTLMQETWGNNIIELRDIVIVWIDKRIKLIISEWVKLI